MRVSFDIADIWHMKNVLNLIVHILLDFYKPQNQDKKDFVCTFFQIIWESKTSFHYFSIQFSIPQGKKGCNVGAEKMKY